MIYAIIDPVKRTVLFANAGHLPPLYKDSTGLQFLEIDSGLPLGFKEVLFTQYRLDMPASSQLLLYSDGVSEAMNASSEEYGMIRIKDHMMNPIASVHSLLNDVHTFLGGYPASDDITLVMIKADN
jgi:sigma-B regulation protein RsbU (phosphoserine phosphatase)